MKKFESFAFRSSSSFEDVCIVLDRSGSTAFRDIEPTRLEAAKEAVRVLLEVKAKKYPGDRVSIVAFSDRSKVLHPLAVVGQDFSSLASCLKKLDSGGYTNITSGLRDALKVLRKKPPQANEPLFRKLERFFFEAQAESREAAEESWGKKVILLSDGAHNSGRGPLPVANQLKKCGVVIAVIGLGSDPNTAEFDEALLKKIASIGPDGKPLYCFINERGALLKAFENLAHHLKKMEDS